MANHREGNIPPESIGFVRGLILTLILAIIANQLVSLPLFSIMGVMIISILLGMVWKGMMTVPTGAETGISFSSKVLLRVGIILMGVRLNLDQIIEAGASIVLIDVIVVVFTISVILFLGRMFSLNEKFSTLLAVGTAICGAAAIVAVAPLIHAKKEYTALAVAFIAILGTIGTIFYTILFSIFDFDSYQYGILVGATLHELAHVVAASVPGGEVGSETAIMVKMGRVALLIPVAMLFGYLYSSKRSKDGVEEKKKKLPIPWFIFGFLGMSVVNTIGILPEILIQFIVSVSVLLMSMAMAGLGLSIPFHHMKKAGINAILVGVIGSILLSILGFLLLLFVY